MNQTIQTDINLKKNLKAIVIGVHYYRFFSQDSQLAGAENDAREVRKFLLNEWQIPDENIVFPGKYGSVDYAEAEDAIIKTLDGMKEDENLLLYYAGHCEMGQNSQKGLCFLTFSDTKMNTKTEELHNVLALNVLNEKLRECKAKVKVRVFDCCHSGERFSDLSDYLAQKQDVKVGGLVGARALTPAAPEESAGVPNGPSFTSRSLEEGMYKEMMRNEKGWVTFTGCNINETSNEVNRNHHRYPYNYRGIFTYCFLEGLSGAAKRDDGPLYIEDLKLYTYDAVLREVDYWNEVYRREYYEERLDLRYGPYEPMVQHMQYQCSISGNITVD
ncbi:MAG: caspase family protein [Clostridiales bacterium]|nr:caspase family protein [Candidatus Blautia equi]